MLAMGIQPEQIKKDFFGMDDYAQLEVPNEDLESTISKFKSEPFNLIQPGKKGGENEWCFERQYLHKVALQYPKGWKTYAAIYTNGTNRGDLENLRDYSFNKFRESNCMPLHFNDPEDFTNCLNRMIVPTEDAEQVMDDMITLFGYQRCQPHELEDKKFSFRGVRKENFALFTISTCGEWDGTPEHLPGYHFENSVFLTFPGTTVFWVDLDQKQNAIDHLLSNGWKQETK
jgi:hypothetical protein